MKRLLLALLLLAAPAQAAVVAGWPDNVITVTDSAIDDDCTGSHAPYDECTGTDTASPTIVGFEGNDILDALIACQTAGGCQIDLGCHEYQRAELHISSTPPEAGIGRHGFAFTTGFQNGLMIRGVRSGEQGCAAGTILHSRSGSTGPASSAFPTAAVIWVDQWDPSGAPTEGVPRVSFRSFECDGDSDLQPAPQILGGTWDTTDQRDNHDCIHFYSDSSAEHYTYVEVLNLWVHHFIGNGISMGDIAQYVIMGNTVNNIGCWQDYSAAVVCDAAGSPFTSISNDCIRTGSGITGCQPTCCTAQGVGATCDNVWANDLDVAGDVECGCASGQPNCYGWNLANEQNTPGTRSPGFKQPGYGIATGNSGNANVIGNTVSSVAKYAIVHSDQTLTPFGGSSHNGRIHGNTVSGSTYGIMRGTSGSNAWISNNTCTSAGINGNITASVACIASNGRGRFLRIENNTISASHGAGILLTTWAYDASVSPAVTIKGNSISSTGDWVQTQNGAGGFVAPIGVQNAASESPCSDAEYQVNLSMLIDGNTVSTGHTGLAGIQLGVNHTSSTCPANIVSPLTISGTNTIGPTTWTGHTTDLGRIYAKNILATGVNLLASTSGRWTWLVNSTGSCSGFTKGSGSDVTDSSTHSIGTCP